MKGIPVNELFVLSFPNHDENSDSNGSICKLRAGVCNHLEGLENGIYNKHEEKLDDSQQKDRKKGKVVYHLLTAVQVEESGAIFIFARYLGQKA